MSALRGNEGFVVSVHLRVAGRVQGVGFRWHVRREALRYRVSGWVRNLPDGDVEVAAEGRGDDLEALIEAVRRGPSGSRVDRLDRTELESPQGYEGFEVRF